MRLMLFDVKLRFDDNTKKIQSLLRVKIQVDSLSTNVCSLDILNLTPSDLQFPPEIYIAVNTLPPGFGV